MCVIAAKPKNTVIPRETLERCFAGNPDGAGFVIARNNQILSMKGFFKFEDFYNAFQPYEKDVAVIHFRIKTHGNKNAEMCHPFEILPNRLWMAHNGIIDISTKNDPSKSDTWHFVDLVMKPELVKDPGAISRPSFQYLVGSTIGHSKLAFLNNRGVITIINKDKGEMDGDVWYSNGSYKAPRQRYQTTAWNAGADNDYDTEVYYSGGTSTKKLGGAGASSCAPCSSPSSNGAGSRTTSTSKTTAYADLKELPASYNWIVENLRDFGFEDDLILNEINADTAEDMALDLLVYEAGRPKDAPPMSREEIAEELMRAEDEADADEAAEALAAEAEAAMTTPLDHESDEAAAIAANVMA